MKQLLDAEDPQEIGPYRLISRIGKGGMGDVFLANDSRFNRQIALKQMNKKCRQHQVLRRRFSHEATIAARLTHPGIIPIHSLDLEQEAPYYIMPYISGHSLKSIFDEARKRDRRDHLHFEDRVSIPIMMRHFLSICQAVDYAFSRGFLHRDIKPGNIILGDFGEVVLLDWGIAHQIGTYEEDLFIDYEEDSLLTQPGKIVGTLAYLAPERALGAPSTIHGEIYSLGVLLYHMLTLSLPFRRPSLKVWKQQVHHEKWIPPDEKAPWRDIPPLLSDIVNRCLQPDPRNRFLTVNELIQEVQRYLNGDPVWDEKEPLDLHCEEQWHYRKRILLPDFIETSSQKRAWGYFALSKEHYSGNMKITTSLSHEQLEQGMGFYLGLSPSDHHTPFLQGCLIWMSPKSIKLFRSMAELMEASIEPRAFYSVSIELIDHQVLLKIDGIIALAYHHPMGWTSGSFGVLIGKEEIEQQRFEVAIGGDRLTVNCLAIPDAFLSHQNYNEAIALYDRIIRAFPGRREAREARFRLACALMENAEKGPGKRQKGRLLKKAMMTLEGLSQTESAPLKAIGEAMIHRIEGDFYEERRCLEFAFYRYPHHPLRSQLDEYVLCRLHETKQKHTDQNKEVYSWLILLLRYSLLPEKNHLILKSLKEMEWDYGSLLQWEALPAGLTGGSIWRDYYALKLASLVNDPKVAQQIIGGEEPPNPLIMRQTILSLIENGHHNLALEILDSLDPNSQAPWLNVIRSLKGGLLWNDWSLMVGDKAEPLHPIDARMTYYLIEKHLRIHNVNLFLNFIIDRNRPEWKSLILHLALLAKEENLCD
ncbi:MAG: protein kinase, partial [Chlamydiota bacterium]|nr:protein kinase [Chlamydiota bacterium]